MFRSPSPRDGLNRSSAMGSVACVRTTRLRSTIELHGSLFISPSLFLLLYSPDSWLNSSKAHRFDFTPSVCALNAIIQYQRTSALSVMYLYSIVLSKSSSPLALHAQSSIHTKEVSMSTWHLPLPLSKKLLYSFLLNKTSPYSRQNQSPQPQSKYEHPQFHSLSIGDQSSQSNEE